MVVYETLIWAMGHRACTLRVARARTRESAAARLVVGGDCFCLFAVVLVTILWALHITRCCIHGMTVHTRMGGALHDRVCAHVRLVVVVVGGWVCRPFINATYKRRFSPSFWLESQGRVGVGGG